MAEVDSWATQDRSLIRLCWAIWHWFSRTLDSTEQPDAAPRLPMCTALPTTSKHCWKYLLASSISMASATTQLPLIGSIRDQNSQDQVRNSTTFNYSCLNPSPVHSRINLATKQPHRSPAESGLPRPAAVLKLFCHSDLWHHGPIFKSLPLKSTLIWTQASSRDMHSWICWFRH